MWQPCCSSPANNDTQREDNKNITVLTTLSLGWVLPRYVSMHDGNHASAARIFVVILWELYCLQKWKVVFKQWRLMRKLHHPGRFLHNYYKFKSVHEGKNDGAVGIFIGLSCELWGFFNCIRLRTLRDIIPLVPSLPSPQFYSLRAVIIRLPSISFILGPQWKFCELNNFCLSYKLIASWARRNHHWTCVQQLPLLSQ